MDDIETKPLVSIIIPCYNMERHLPRMLDSVLAQTYPSIEVLAVDDGSRDDTFNILNSYVGTFEQRGFKLRVLHKVNGGAASAINVALPLFAGEFLMWVDGDDILLPENVSRKVSFLQKHPECGFVLCEGVVVSEVNLNVPLALMRRIPPVGKDTLFEDLIMENNVIFGPGTIAARAKAVRTAIPSLHIFESVQGQNWQLMLPLAYREQCGYIRQVLFKCVSHVDSHSRKPRSYRELIQRQYDFQELIVTTIASIPGIEVTELEAWQRQVGLKHSRKRLQEALRQNNKDDIEKFKDEVLKYTDELRFCEMNRLIWLVVDTEIRIAKKLKGLLANISLRVNSIKKSS